MASSAPSEFIESAAREWSAHAEVGRKSQTER
jgi:hypothetical protein